MTAHPTIRENTHWQSDAHHVNVNYNWIFNFIPKAAKIFVIFKNKLWTNFWRNVDLYQLSKSSELLTDLLLIDQSEFKVLYNLVCIIKVPTFKVTWDKRWMVFWTEIPNNEKEKVALAYYPAVMGQIYQAV